MEYSTEKTNIAVIGGGNIGTQFACVCASKGYKVNLYSTKPERFGDTIEMIYEKHICITGKLHLVSNDLCSVIEDASLIFVTYPAFMFADFARQLSSAIRPGTIIVVLPGTGGAEYAFWDCIKKGAIIIGLQRVPMVARLEEYGKIVRCEGMRDELFYAKIPGTGEIGDFPGFMKMLWGISCTELPNYLCVTLTPSNPILHTTRLRVLFKDYGKGKRYERNPLFYGEWDDESSELLLLCDSELQELLKRLDEMDLSSVRSLRTHYGCDTIEGLTQKLRSIKSLHSLSSPMKKAEDAWIPDFDSRYFKADYAYGLAIIEEFMDIAQCEAPNIRETMDWYRSISGDNAFFDIRQYGINCKEDIYDFYSGKSGQ